MKFAEVRKFDVVTCTKRYFLAKIPKVNKKRLVFRYKKCISVLPYVTE